jgi:type IV pilus assembly protein PilA
MKKEMNNKGFSLVELIIVVAIMAVLIGVLAPTYLKYVENSKRTSDCTSIGSILDACEVLSIDPVHTWTDETIKFKADGSYDSTSSVSADLEAITGVSQTKLQANWGAFNIAVTKDANGAVTFDASNVTGNTEATNPFVKYSPALAGRLE